MATRAQFRQLSFSRLKAGKILLREGDYDGSVYIVGYSLELALKAVICKRLNFPHYPDVGSSTTPMDVANIFRTHDLDILLTLSGMSNDISLVSTNTRLFQNWSDLTKWKPSLRYEPLGTYSLVDAQRMIEALEETPNGVLTWIRSKRKW